MKMIICQFMFFKLINKEVIMKNNQEKAAMTAAEKLRCLRLDWRDRAKG